jgi:uncharacterized protein YjbI with pentapeptide repeats
MANKKERAWYIDKLGKIGIVEKATSLVSRDGYTSNWTSISEAKSFRIYAISRDDDLTSTDLSNTYNQIPVQFHESIVSKVIAMGYKDPRNMDLNNAQFFEAEYAVAVKEGKKFSKADYSDVGFIASQDF